MLRFKLVIFDFDGTLGDTFQWFKGAINEAAKKYHFLPIQESEVEELRNFDVHQIIKHLQISWWKKPLIASFMRRRMREDVQALKLFDGTLKMLNDLVDGGAELAIVSSNAYDNIAHLLGPEVTKKIRHFECGVSILGKKARFKKLLRSLNLKPEEVIYIGDETRDLDAARACNIPFGAVSWGYARINFIAQYEPEFVFNRMEDIPQCLL